MTNAKLEAVLARLPDGVGSVQSVPLSLSEPFVDIVQRFAHQPGTVALVSGGSLDCARYNILGIWPWLTLRGGLNQVTVEHGNESLAVQSDSLTVLKEVVQRLSSPELPALPLSSGLLGYLSYDLKDALEVLPRTSVADHTLPHLYMVAPSLLLIEDRLEKRATVYLPNLGANPSDASERLRAFEYALRQPKMPLSNFGSQGAQVKSGFTREEYKSAVEAIREYIARGHVYQVNMSQRFEVPFDGDAFELFVNLFAKNPAPFFAYINALDHHIVSTSPERFILLNGRAVETRPIKGTRPRGKTPEEDALLRQELLQSRKDESELSMIVDLLRNDIGRVCQAGSVRVTEHKRIEAYENVYHLVSTVCGTLDEDKDAVDLIRATFPGGSITGCPKIRAMEVIDELEPVRRHVYTGSIGYIGFNGTMDLSIAIRTATIAEGRLVFSVGGGVVYDSNPNDEYEETLHKGRTLMNALNLGQAKEVASPSGYCNGIFKAIDDIRVSVQSDGFAYGYGIFETIRVERGVPQLLGEHLERFERSWRYCFNSPFPDITWRDVIEQVVYKNNLSEGTAAVKLLAAGGKGDRKAFDETLVVTARKYVHRLAGKGRLGLHLATYAHPRHSPLFAHKTMNYAFYKMAGQWALQQKADEALILDLDLNVSETNTANVFCSMGGKLFRTLSENALPGTMENAAVRLLEAWGISVERRKLSVAELKSAEFVFVTNALMGAVPVIRIDGEPLSPNVELCRKLNEALLGNSIL